MEITLAQALNLPAGTNLKNVQVKLPENFPPQLLGTVQKLIVQAQTTQAKFVLQSSSGQTFEAEITPPVPAGSKITLLAKTPQEVNVRQLIIPKLAPTTEIKPVLTQNNPVITAKINTIRFSPQSLPILPATINSQGVQPPLNTPLQANILQNKQSLTLNLPQNINIEVKFSTPQTLPPQTALTVILKPDVNIPTPQNSAPTNAISVQVVKVVLPAQVTTHPQANTSTTSQLTQPISTPQVSINLPKNFPVIPNQTFAVTTPISNATNTNSQLLVALPNGQQVTINSTQPLAGGVEMTIKISPDGLPQIIKIGGENLPQQQGNQLHTPTGTEAKTAPPTALPALTPGATFKGLITEQLPHNQATVTLSNGTTLTVHTDKSLPTATQIYIKIDADGKAQITDLTLPTGSQRADNAYKFSKEWPMLKQALNLIQQHKPELMEKALLNIPRPNTLLPTLINFADALQNGAVEKLLGNETVNLLRAMGIDLTPDLQQLSHLQNKPESTDNWRGLLFPYVENDGEDPQQGGFFWRRQDEDENSNKEQSLRFIMQLKLSQMGEIQLDGLLHDGVANLKLRFNKEPGEEFRQGVKTLVTNTLSAYGLEGDVQIEIVKDFPIIPLAEIQHHAGHMNFTA